MPAKIGDAVLVEWEDSYGCSSTWQDIPEEGEPHALRCKSLGWITGQSGKCLVIVPHLAQNGDVNIKQGCGDMTIPAAAILRITRIPLRKGS
jgi:hypothetical protein